jgi:hypothetical protein
LYKKINTFTQKYVKKSNELKPNDKVLPYIIEIERQIDPIIDFCEKLGTSQIIKEN